MPKVPVGAEAGLFRKLTEGLLSLPEDVVSKVPTGKVALSKPGVDTRLSTIYGDRLKIAARGPSLGRNLRDLELLPDSYHQKLAEYFAGHPDGGIYIVDGPVTDVFTELRGRTPRGWPADSTWDDVAGATQPNTRRVVIGGLEPEVRPYMALHETGHTVDHALGGLSASQEFKDLYNKLGTMNPYYSQPGSAGRGETFSQSFSAWVHNRDMPPNHRAMAIADALDIKEDKKFRGGLLDSYFTRLERRIESPK